MFTTRHVQELSNETKQKYKKYEIQIKCWYAENIYIDRIYMYSKFVT